MQLSWTYLSGVGLSLRIERNIPVQQLTVSRITVHVVSGAGPFVVHRAAAPPAVTSSLDRLEYTGAVSATKVRLNRPESVAGRVSFHRRESPIVASAVRDAPRIVLRTGGCGNEKEQSQGGSPQGSTGYSVN